MIKKDISSTIYIFLIWDIYPILKMLSLKEGGAFRVF